MEEIDQLAAPGTVFSRYIYCLKGPACKWAMSDLCEKKMSFFYFISNYVNCPNWQKKGFTLTVRKLGFGN